MADVGKWRSSDGTLHNIRDSSAVGAVSKVDNRIVVTTRGGTSTSFDLDTYTIVKQAQPDYGYTATYRLQKNGTDIGEKINITAVDSNIEQRISALESAVSGFVDANDNYY